MQEYFTLKEAAEYLGYGSEDQVFEAMLPGTPGPSLCPAYVVENSLEVNEIGGNGDKEKIGPGAFEIDVFPYQGAAGRVCLLRWDEHDMAYVNEFTSYEPYEQPEDVILSLYPKEEDRRNRRDSVYGEPEPIPKDLDAHERPAPNQSHRLVLWQKGWMRVRRYVLANNDYKIPVPKSAIVVLRESLLAYMQAVGKKPPEALREKFNAEAFIEDCRKRKMPKELIAAKLKEKKITGEEIGKLLLQTMGPATDETWAKRGNRLAADGKKKMVPKA